MEDITGIKDVTWTVSSPKNKKTIPKIDKLPHADAFPIDSKTPKGELYVRETWNAMRQRLIDIGEMEEN